MWTGRKTAPSKSRPEGHAGVGDAVFGTDNSSKARISAVPRLLGDYPMHCHNTCMRTTHDDPVQRRGVKEGHMDRRHFLGVTPRALGSRIFRASGNAGPPGKSAMPGIAGGASEEPVSRCSAGHARSRKVRFYSDLIKADVFLNFLYTVCTRRRSAPGHRELVEVQRSSTRVGGTFHALHHLDR